ncbi:helix-turn-helix domain-containing protein [Spirosoma arcticum]
METEKRKRGKLSRQVPARIAPQQRARTLNQMSIADALEAKGWSKSEFASRMNQRLSGTQNFTIDTLSDIEETLGVQLLVTDCKPAADASGTGGA